MKTDSDRKVEIDLLIADWRPPCPRKISCISARRVGRNSPFKVVLKIFKGGTIGKNLMRKTFIFRSQRKTVLLCFSVWQTRIRGRLGGKKIPSPFLDDKYRLYGVFIKVALERTWKSKRKVFSHSVCLSRNTWMSECPRYLGCFHQKNQSFFARGRKFAVFWALCSRTVENRKIMYI